MARYSNTSKLSSLEPGQIVRTVDGSAYRVSSKTASPKGIAYKLADLSGKPVPTPANFRPVGLAMARFASWLRYHLAYNKDFDLYVNSYIEKFNTEHPEGPLPLPAGPDGKPFRWADWFQRNIASKLYVNIDPGQAQAMKDEVIHEMLFTVLGQRHAIDKFAEKIKRFNKNDTVKNMSVARQLTVYLTTIFSHKHRLMEMQNLLKEQQPEQEMSMWQPGMGEEGDEGSEQNILDTEEYGVGKADFESAEAQKDIAKFRDGFGHWLKSKYSEKVSSSFLTLFDIYSDLISQSGSDEVQDVEKSDKQKKKEERKSWMVSRADLMPLWAERTGLSEGSMKDYLGRLPGLMEEYITTHAKALGESNIFVSLMNEINKENKKPKARPAKASVTASDEGDIQKQMDAEYAIHGKSEKWFKLRDQQTTRHPKKAYDTPASPQMPEPLEDEDQLYRESEEEGRQVSATVSAHGTFPSPPPKATGLGATMGQPPGVVGQMPAAVPRAGGAGLAAGMGELDAGTAPWVFNEAVDACQRLDVRIGPEPAQPGVMRPSGETAVASAITSPAPPAARAPRWTRCQSFATPSTDEYMHIGETPMRFRSVSTGA